MGASRLSEGGFPERSISPNAAESPDGEKENSTESCRVFGEQYLEFDHAAYERDGRIIRTLRRLPATIVVVTLGLGLVFLALHLVDELDRRGDKPWQAIMVPKAPPRGNPSARSPGQTPMLAMPPAAMRELRDRVIRGEIDRETMESFREFPDYERCQKCLSECDAKAENKSGWQAQECRRNCLHTCSEHGRRLMEL